MRELVLNKCFELQEFEWKKELRFHPNYMEYLHSMSDDDLFNHLCGLLHAEEGYWRE